jgi:hypothetical protein
MDEDDNNRFRSFIIVIASFGDSENSPHGKLDGDMGE